MLSRPCLNLSSLENLQELDYTNMNAIPSVITKPGIVPELDDDPDDILSPLPTGRRVIVVANHLPLRPAAQPAGGQIRPRLELDEDSLYLQLREGLDCKETEVIYVGCLKTEVDPRDQDEISSYLLDKFKCLPVFLPGDVQSKFYHGFCKHYLWPLFHYKIPFSPGHGSGYDPAQWQAYVAANVAFAHKVVEAVRSRGGGGPGEDDFVWVHDYHLMVLPSLLRRRLFRVKLGFFLHSPFPSSELFRAVPAREEILRGLLNADLVGFQTFDYARHFLSCCSRMLGLDYRSKRGYLGLDYYGRTVSVKILPVGIHMGQLQSLGRPETAKRVGELRERFKGRVVIVGVDDMDVLKGISFKFLALGHLLENQPKLRGKLVLVQIANPARSRGADVRELQDETHRICREINEKFGGPGYDPIVFIEDPVSTLEKVAYYAISECCLLNAVRDGMNLVPYKYTVCRQGSPELDAPRRSAIIVSEFVGCSPSLSGAIRVNPWDVERVSEAMLEAVAMEEGEKRLRHEQHYRYISSHDIGYWARSFDQDLARACGDPYARRCWGIGFGLRFRVVALPPDFRKLSVDHIRAGYREAGSRLVLLDYDGTMFPQSPSVDKAPGPEIVSLLNGLCDDPRNTVFLVSGRERGTLERWFSGCGKLGISAEHGYLTRWSKGCSWECGLRAGTDLEWKRVVRPIMEHYAEATDGSFIEFKESAMVWNYQDADMDFGACQSKELLDHLESVLANEPVVVKRGKHIVEVIPQGVSKGTVVENVIATMRRRGRGPDFVLCVGDDRSDEDMFESIGRAEVAEVYACTVGQKPSMAKYYLDDSSEVIALLQGLAGAPGPPQQQQPKAAESHLLSLDTNNL